MKIRPVVSGTLPRRRIRFPGGGIQGEVTAFCRILRKTGLKATSGRIIDLFNSFDHLDITDLQYVYVAAKSNLVSSQEESVIFDAIFRRFWFDERGNVSAGEDSLELDAELENELAEGAGEGPGDSQDDKESETDENKTGSSLPGDEAEEGADPGEGGEDEEGVPAYSPVEVLSQKDFSSIQGDRIHQLRRLIAKLIPKLATRLSRRKKAAASAREIDLRRSVKRSIRTGGEVIKLFRRKRRIQKTQILLLCDVSGSMDSYSQFLIQFLYSLQHEIKSLWTFVFSTRLTDATPYLRHKDVNVALSRLSHEVHDWSGGTQIGNCLRTFNYDYGRQILNSRTIVLIISDGWDRGDTDLLALEMDRLKKKCRHLIWLNPLLGSPGYRPIDRGMRTALPYCDDFLPAHNLESLVDMTHKISKL